MYQLTARQILLIAFLSALFAAGTIACLDRFRNRLETPTVAFTDTPPAGISDPSTVNDERNNIEVYRALSPGVVNITSIGRGDFFNPEPRPGTGSGAIIDDQGHILTNEHVIADAQRLTVNLGGNRTYPARVVGRDTDTDLAVIKIDAPRDQLTIVPFGDSDSLIVGQKVLAIGNPFGFDRTLTTGIISGLQRPIRARNGRSIEGAIQTDASINPGNSGGPLLDSRGRMIGINSQILSPTGGSVGVGFAVPINIARRVVPQLIRDGYVTRPRLGVYARDVRELAAQVNLPVNEGAIILQVEPNGAAAAAGLRGFQETPTGEIVLGDIIVAINGQQVRTRDDLTRILDQLEVGQEVQVEVVRDGGQRTTVPVRLRAEQRPPVRR